MIEGLVGVLPIFILFFIAYLLKKLHVLEESLGSQLLRLIFYITSPLLTFRAIRSVELEMSLIMFPLSAAILVLVAYGLVQLTLRKLHLPGKQEGPYVLASMIVNSGFALPFLIALAGDAGVVRHQLFNVGLYPFTMGWCYIIAVRYGSGKKDHRLIVRKLVQNPIIWALILGLIANITQLDLPSFIWTFANPIADMTAPLIVIALGLLFAPKLAYPMVALRSLSIRMIAGLGIGLLITSIFGFEGIDRLALLLLAAAPMGYNTITYSALEKLDEKFAAQLVSIGLAAGLILFPMIILLFG